MKPETEPKPDFEKALSELEELVAHLESGELSLNQSLEHFKRGVELTRTCQSILDDAQKTIELLGDRGEDALADPPAGDVDN